MHQSPNGPTGHSADVRISLFVSGTSFDVAQIGGGRLIFQNPVMLPIDPEGAQGVVALSIDGEERRWAVDLKPQRGTSYSVEVAFREPGEVSIARGIQG